MIDFVRVILLLMLALVIMPAFVFANDSQAARKELDRLGIPFTPEEFFRQTEAGNTEIVGLFLDAGIDRNLVNSRGWTGLFVAAGKGHVETVRLLIDRGLDVNAQGGGLTALRLAAHNGHAEAVKLLLDKGADVNAKGFIGDTVLSDAILVFERRSNIDVINLLLEAGADVNAKTIDGGFPLMSAAMGGHAEVVEALIRHGANVNEQSLRREEEDGLTALMMAAWTGQMDTVKMLLKYGANADLRDASGDTAAAAAASGGHPEIALLLKQAMQHPDASGLNALMWAAVIGNIPEVRSLVAQHHDVNAQGPSGKTALHYAVSNGRKEIIEILLAGKADVNAADAAGEVPLMTAVWKNHPELLKLLIASGARVDAKDACNVTAIHQALSAGRIEAAEILLNSGADVNAGRPLDIAYIPANSLQLLLKHGIEVDVNVQDDRGWTPLFSAVFGQEVEKTRVLIQVGAKVDVKDRKGKMPLSIAQERGNAEIVQLLKAAGAKE